MSRAKQSMDGNTAAAHVLMQTQTLQLFILLPRPVQWLTP